MIGEISLRFGPICAPSGAFLFFPEKFQSTRLSHHVDRAFSNLFVSVRLKKFRSTFRSTLSSYFYSSFSYIYIYWTNGPIKIKDTEKIYRNEQKTEKPIFKPSEYIFYIRNKKACGPSPLVHFGFLCRFGELRENDPWPLKLVSGSGFLNSMKEIQSNTQIVNSIRPHWFVHKLMDMPNAVRAVTRFMPSKPFDIFAFIHGKGVGIETKLLKKWKGFSISYLRENQIEALDEVLMAGGRAFVFVHVCIPANVVEGTKRVNRLIILDWAKWNQKLIRKKDLINYPYIEGKKGKFDLSSFFLDIKNGK